MRISVTDRCNLRCTFCMPEGGNAHFSQEELLTAGEIVRAVRAAASLGIRKFRLTGGEPLVREDISELTAQIAAVRGVPKVVMTTNGVLLEEKAEELVRAGLSGVNVSLCAVDEEIYRSVTGSDAFARVHRGICAAKEAGLAVRINCVPMAGVNAGQLADIAAYAKERAVDVCFIEMMPIGRGGEYSYLTSAAVCEILKRHYGAPAAQPFVQSDGGPAVYYRFPGFLGNVGFISARSHKFCGQCNRVRLTADGKLKLCLAYADGVDLRKALQCGDDAQLAAVMREAVYKKPREHDFDMGAERGFPAGTQQKVRNTAPVSKKAAAQGEVFRREEHYMPQIGG